MSTTLTIDGVNKATIVNWKSVQREEVLTREPNSLEFLIKKHGGQTYKPVSGDEVVLTVGATKEFGGYIVEIEETVDARVEYLKITCKDYTQTLDRYLVSKTYNNETVNDIIADLIDTFAPDFTYTNVSCPVTIDKIQFNYLPISQCLQKLTEIVSGYDWYADYNKDIHFFFTEAEIASFDLTDTSGNYLYNSLVVREDTHQMRNEIIVRGGLLTGVTLRSEYWSGDGTRLIFPLATKFAALPTVTVGGTPITVGVDFLDLPASFTALWNYNEKSLKFTSAPTSGTNNIVITQYPQYPLILQRRDEASIALYGLYQFIVIDKTIRDLDTATLRAQAELIKHGQPLKTANFTTFTAGLITGQTINVQSTIRGIDQDFKVQSIRSYLKTPDTDELTHEVECTTADDIGINDILAKLLVKNPSDQIDILEDEVVARIRQFEETLAITDTIGTPETSTGPYIWGGLALLDSYSESNFSTGTSFGTTTSQSGQSFVGDGNNLGSAKFYLKKTGTCDGTIVAVLYASTGTLPTGSILATSNTYTANDLTTSYQLIEFTFPDGQNYNLVNSTEYFIAVKYTGTTADGNITVGADSSSPSHSGEAANFTTVWNTSSNDRIFYLYTQYYNTGVYNFATWS